VHPNSYSIVLKHMDPSIEIDDAVDFRLPVNDEEYQEAVGGQPEDGFGAESGDGMPQEQGVDQTGPNPGDAASADAHNGQVTGDGQVAGPSGLQGGAISNSVEASATSSVQNPVPRNVLATQAMQMNGVHAPVAGAMPGVCFRPPDPSELYALPRMPYSRVEHPPAVGQPVPAPITATVRNTVPASTVLTTAVSAAQVGPAYSPYAGPWTPSMGAYAVRPMYGAADYMYPYGTMFADPRGVGMYGYPGAGYAEIGATGGVSVGVVGNPEPNGHPELGSLSARAGAVPRCEPVTGGQGARPKEARTTRYQGYRGVPTDVMRTDQATVDGRAGWTGQAAAAGYRPSGQAVLTVPDGIALASTRPESPAVMSTLPVGHHLGGCRTDKAVHRCRISLLEL